MPYDKMARYYDLIYQQIVDYEADVDFIQKVFGEHSQTKVRTILDIGCGTGNHSFALAKRGYNVTGIDLSKEMIRAAIGKKRKRSDNPSFHVMDMRRIDLGEKFDAALVLFGGFGYLLKDSDLRRFFSSVRKHLNSGLLMYEFWQTSATMPAARTKSGYTTWDRVEDEEKNLTLIRLNRNRLDTKTSIATINFDIYVFDTRRKKVLDEFSEVHKVRTFSISSMRKLLKANGFRALGFYVGDVKSKSMSPAKSDTFRVFCVAAPS